MNGPSWLPDECRGTVEINYYLTVREYTANTGTVTMERELAFKLSRCLLRMPFKEGIGPNLTDDHSVQTIP